MKFLKQSAGLSLAALLMGLAPSTQAQAPFGAPNPNGGFGQPRPASPFGSPGTTPGVAPGTITPTPGTPVLPAIGRPVTAVPTTYLWDSGGQVAISRVGAWGNGVGEVTSSLTYNGDNVLQMVTRNFNEGVTFEFTPPVNLDDYKTAGYLRLRLRFQDAMGFGGPGGFGMGGPGGPPGSDGQSRRGRRGRRGGSSSSDSGGTSMMANQQMDPRRGSSGRGGFDGTPQPGFGGGFAPPDAFGRGSAPPGGFGSGMMPPDMMMPGMMPGMRMGPLPQTTKIKRMLVTFVLEKGIASGTLDLPADLSKITPDDSGWRLFLMPVTDLKYTKDAEGLAQRMILTSDQKDTFYMAQSALVVETGQMSVNIRRPTDPFGTQIGELTVKPGLVTLVADVEAGTADPLIEWNFDADNVNPEIAMRRQPLLPPTAMGGFGSSDSGGGGFDAEGQPIQPGFGGGTPPPGFGRGTPPPGFGGTPQPGFGRGTPPPGFGGSSDSASSGFGGSSGQFGTPGGLFGNEGGPVPGMFLGPPVDARGLVAKFQYPNEEMDYRIEVTVTDRAGKKAPVKASILIKVRS